MILQTRGFKWSYKLFRMEKMAALVWLKLELDKKYKIVFLDFFLYNFDFPCHDWVWICWIWICWDADVRRFIILVCVIMLGTNTCFNTSMIYEDNNSFKHEALRSDIVSRSNGWESTP